MFGLAVFGLAGLYCIFQEAFATIGGEDLTEGQLQDLFNVIQQFTSISESSLYFYYLEKCLQKQPSTLEPLKYGWIEQDNTFILKWFEGDQLPSFVSDLITNIPESDSIDDEDDLYNDEHYPDDDE
ncbi:uncharacterized protein TNCV_2241581 [Trichonephila clavipes]|nr:uncharacterized protein TNCV_2241581 [Trichonephila clavipes]